MNDSRGVGHVLGYEARSDVSHRGWQLTEAMHLGLNNLAKEAKDVSQKIPSKAASGHGPRVLIKAELRKRLGMTTVRGQSTALYKSSE